MKDAYYFSHDSNARNDEKILALMADHGVIAYGIYWILVEMMFESTNTKLSHDKTKGIAFTYSIDITTLNKIITDAIKLNLFLSDGDYFWSESLLRRKQHLIENRLKKSQAGKIGMAKRWGVDNTVITEDNTVITKHNKGKERIVKESKVKEEHTSKAKEIIDLYHQYLPMLPVVKKLTDPRISAINNRLDEYTIDEIETMFKMASKSDFLTGKSKDWSANFDWLMKPSNFIKVLEGNYANKEVHSGPIPGDSKQDNGAAKKWNIDHLILKA